MNSRATNLTRLDTVNTQIADVMEQLLASGNDLPDLRVRDFAVSLIMQFQFCSVLLNWCVSEGFGPESLDANRSRDSSFDGAHGERA